MRVLIVEDGKTLRLLIVRALRQIPDVEIVEAGDGVEALAKLATFKPDVILTDINMPQMDGFTLIERLRARPDLKDIPVVVITTEGALNHLERGRLLGVAAYATKPVKADAIAATLRQVLDRPR
jgi:two-component system chemotaxis response regulator CheY